MKKQLHGVMVDYVDRIVCKLKGKRLRRCRWCAVQRSLVGVAALRNNFADLPVRQRIHVVSFHGYMKTSKQLIGAVGDFLKKNFIETKGNLTIVTIHTSFQTLYDIRKR